MAEHATDPPDPQRASLRRVAALVAAGAPSREVFAAVAQEVAQVTGSALVQIQRYEPDDTVIVAGAWGVDPHPFQPGTKWGLEGSQIAGAIKRTRAVVRIDDWGRGRGPIQSGVRETGIRGGAGAPIIVGGELWGCMAAGPAKGEPVPPGLQDRLAAFTELVATAISSAENREALARLADEQAALRRVATLVAKDVPTSQLFAAVVEEVGHLLNADVARMMRYLPGDETAPVAVWPAGERSGRGEPGVACPVVAGGRVWGELFVRGTDERGLPRDAESRLADFTELVEEALAHAESATGDLRELAHGILPSVLHRGGLKAGAEVPASRMTVPVEVDITADYAPEAIEATAYFVMAEALTNVAKHAGARQVAVRGRVEDGALRVEVRDDGAGGARADGSGLVGLRDRLAAHDGVLTVDSPPGGGTRVEATIPLRA